MDIVVHRIYEKKQEPGYRVLIDRLWPRGISKARANLDEWYKELAPSTELRLWFGHAPEKWPEFCKRYREELHHKREAVKTLLHNAEKQQKLILLYGSKEKERNHAIVLKNYLEKMIK